MAQTTNRDYYKILGVTTKTPKRELKKKYACGGTAKEGYVFLQGDHRDTIKDTLVKLGFAEDTIELH